MEIMQQRDDVLCLLESTSIASALLGDRASFCARAGRMAPPMENDREPNSR